ncbi:MAG: hypothetical protein HOE48_11615 [Candidatus Latescibacteria bacterium]|jgi:hypothetical protein|nr:hypothetical protein [Candidatus Latescibacterota bacterium]
MKNPFLEFESESGPSQIPQSESNRVSGLLSRSHNPFAEFAPPETLANQALPMDEILASHAEAMALLTEAYKRLIAQCVGDSVWREDRASIERTYAAALQIARETPWHAEDVSTFGEYALQKDDPDFFLIGPLGLFLSAFCNASDLSDMKLDLGGQDLRVPLVGYRLRSNLSLTVVGHLGDLTGISLDGGHLKIEGSVGRYLGAGMTDGQIDVSGDVGRFVGEQMTGGLIHVMGRLGGLGTPNGGLIRHRKQLVFGAE